MKRSRVEHFRRKGDLARFGVTVDYTLSEKGSRLPEPPLFLGQPKYDRHGAIAPYKSRLLGKLNEPIKRKRITKAAEDAGGTDEQIRQRIEREIKTEHDIRIEAAMALFDVPNSWPEAVQWQWLALCLLGKHYRGCRTLTKGPGAPPTVPPEEYIKLSASFEDFKRKYEAKYDKRSGKVTGQAYLHQNGGTIQVGPERIASVSGLLNAVGRGKQIAAKKNF
jgi:hypothetical protein